VAIDMHFLEPRFDGPMLAIQKSVRRSKIELVWRNRFPVRWERSSGPPVLVVKNDRVATPNWLQSLIRFCGLVLDTKALWHGMLCRWDCPVGFLNRFAA
jgi:hypothetical protein